MPENRELCYLPVAQIHDPPNPLRQSLDPDRLRELSDSMARDGLLEPIGVAPDDVVGEYRLLYGHRRLAAARLLGWVDIPCLVHPKGTHFTDPALAENLHREPLTPLEEARALRTLLDRTGDPHAVAHTARKSVEWVRARLSILQYPDDLQDAIHTGGLPLSVAHLLAQVDHADYRAYLVRDALAHGATARTVGVWVQHYHAERDSIHHNEAVVADIAARRDQYVVLVPCDYCGDKEDLRATTAWRLCRRCTTALRAALTPPTTESQAARP